jgi:pyruvate, water dikinase
VNLGMRSSGNIRWFADITLNDRGTVGGKGGSLGELVRAGITVPAGFVLCTAAFEQVLEAVEKHGPIRSRIESLTLQDLREIRLLSEEARARIREASLPEELRTEIIAAHAKLCAENLHWPLAVRSSATTEDAEDASFAGLQDTYLWVTDAETTLKNVLCCWASLYSVPSLAYRLKRKVPENGVAIAVVVQRMVDARTAGVMFTRSPLTGDRSVITIEATWGLGSAIVGGEVTPDRFVISKITPEISVREISDKHVQHVPAEGGGIKTVETPPELRRAPCISDEELATLKEIARKVERHYGRPQDIEWAIDRSGQVQLLQSRPETVWSLKDQTPVAKPVENPISHVMNIFGGRR